jgi:hypothetical protein
MCSYAILRPECYGQFSKFLLGSKRKASFKGSNGVKWQKVREKSRKSSFRQTAFGEGVSQHAQSLLIEKAQVILAGDYNVIPTELDVYDSASLVKDALFRPEAGGLRAPARTGVD